MAVAPAAMAASASGWLVMPQTLRMALRVTRGIMRPPAFAARRRGRRMSSGARPLNDFAALYYQHGDLDKAEKMWREAIVVFRDVGDTQGLAASSNNVGDVLMTRGKLAEARKLLEQAIAGYELVGDRSGVALAKVDLGQ